MDYSLLIQLGLGGGILYVMREAMIRSDKRIDERDKSFTKFVDEHNDKMTQLVVESTQAIKESSLAIKSAAAVMEKILSKLEKNQSE